MTSPHNRTSGPTHRSLPGDLRERIRRLDPDARSLLRERLLSSRRQDAAARLVAYVVPCEGKAADPSELRDHLRAVLPAFMIPEDIVFLDALPRTPNGKLDTQALPEPHRSSIDSALAEPQTSTERVLAAIWSDLLGMERLSIHDNFFEIGGDSITSIRIVSRCAREGLQFTAADLMQHPTVAGLAAVIDHTAEAVAEQGFVTGAVALTPIQRWFFQQALSEPGHWNQSVWLDAPADLDLELFRAALHEVIGHHDALRLRFRPTPLGWRADQVGVEDLRNDPAAFHLSDCSSEEGRAVLQSAEARLTQEVRLNEPPLIRCAICYHDAGARILLTAHHLVVDAVSWPIILEDLEAAYDAIESGRPPVLPRKTTSFKAWSEALQTYAESDEILRDLAYWQQRDALFMQVLNGTSERDGAPRFEHTRYAAPDRSDDGRSRRQVGLSDRALEGAVRSVEASLDEAETRNLFTRAPATYAIRADELLLAALARQIAELSGRATVRIDVEGHGREDIGSGLDVSRTVGWFTTLYPLVFRLPDSSDPTALLRSVKEQVRGVPHRGLSYGLLRYVHGFEGGNDEEPPGFRVDAFPALEDLPADVLFNFGGREDQLEAGLTRFRAAGAVYGARAPENIRSHPLELDAFVRRGRLVLRWAYASNVIGRSVIEELAAEHLSTLRKLLAHCLDPEASGYAPVDFPDAGLSQDALDRLLDRFSP